MRNEDGYVDSSRICRGNTDTVSDSGIVVARGQDTGGASTRTGRIEGLADTGYGSEALQRRAEKAQTGQTEESRESEAMKGVQILPSCPVDSRHLLPSVSAIYFLLCGDECLYVGKSINLQYRWHTHEKLSEVEDLTGLRVAWKPVPESCLDTIEREMVAALRPRYNYNLMPQPLKLSQSSVTVNEEGKLLTTWQVAERLGVHRSRVQVLIREGRLPARLYGKVYLVDEKDLEQVSDRKPGRPPKTKETTKKTKGKQK